MENNNEEILIKLDENNLIHIDPNTVLKNGKIEPRSIKQEELVMYVNLEADLIPRSTFLTEKNQTTLRSVAKGTLNLLNNKNSNVLDTSWTDSFFEYKNNGDEFYQNDNSSQSFGITNISINILGGSFIPKVTITFVDVRGKTLFESPENSPYSAFFHLPWPIFYLTIKGYYGKAIRYRLHMTNFLSKYNESNGNFDITGTFVGSTYAYLTDIPLMGMLNSPYMFLIENDKTTKYNEQTQTVSKKISKSSKGYRLLKNIYKEYIDKGYLPKDFPLRTLREIIVKAKSLDRIIEREIFDQIVDTRIFAGIKEFEKHIKDFVEQVKSWQTINLTNEFFTEDGLEYNYLNKRFTDSSIIDGDNNSLKLIINKNLELLKNNKIFTEKLINKTTSKFDGSTINYKNTIKSIDKYKYNKGKLAVSTTQLLLDIEKLYESFDSEKKKLQDTVEKKINEIFRDKEKGLGFIPTIRNVFGVLLAHADLYVRLHKEVHEKAINVGQLRKSLLTNYSKETNDENIYPWPQILKKSQTKENILTYPGDKELRNKLKSNDVTLWPEIDFLENYHSTATIKLDPLAEKEGGVQNITFVLEDDDKSKMVNGSTLLTLNDYEPYSFNSFSTLLYEIWERAKVITLYDKFSPRTIIELAKNEFDNIDLKIKEDYDIKNLLSKINSIDDFINTLKNTTFYDKFQYFIDEYYITNYIDDVEQKSFNFEFYKNSKLNINNDNKFTNTKNDLLNYKVDDYRNRNFPFNSNLYLSYIGKNNTNDELNLTNNFKIDTGEGFITTYKNKNSWIKEEYIDNIFGQNLKFKDSTYSCNILNTPYFHKQLLSDFKKTSSYNKYAGSSYLLLNSLPFYDLNDMITPNSSIRMSSLFKEIGATHYVPYFLILKWGSIYHRYKTYINENVDILNGFLVDNITENINGSEFYDVNGNIDNVYYNVKYSNGDSIGFHPYYESIFNQIINGYNIFDINNPNDYTEKIINNTILNENFIYENFNFYTKIVNNKNLNTNDNFYTLLPSNGFNIGSNKGTFDKFENNNLKIIWDDINSSIEFNNKIFPSYDQYNKNLNLNTEYDNQYLISNDYRKIIDLISVFSPSILEEFENQFILFSNDNFTNGNLKYTTFKTLLKNISTIDVNSSDNVKSFNFFNDIKNKQKIKLKNISNEILSEDYLIKLTIGNPKEIIPHIWSGFSRNKTKYSDVQLTHNKYNTSQNNIQNRKLIELYLGYEPIEDCYFDFFVDFDIEINEENIINFRPLIYLYAGYKNSNGTGDFRDYIKNNFFGNQNIFEDRLLIFLNNIIGNFPSLTKDNTNNKVTINDGFNDELLKIELYNHFKVFNDRWIAGNSIGQKLLIEEFLFLDKANSDIGDKLFFDISKLVELENDTNIKQNLYGAISILLRDTNIDMRVLPSYVNFYNYDKKDKKIVPSKKIAKNLFGNFLEIDYEDSSPKVILQYVGPSSNYLDMSEILSTKKFFKFNNDSFNIGVKKDNSLIITSPENYTDDMLMKSNKVVSFEVSVGDINQNIFTSVSLDQSNFKNTTESYIAQDNLARSESGSASHQIDVGLFNIFKNNSYTCDVSCLGNVMIQPTMYFYLKNIPLFRGTYWITEVTHGISNGTFKTSFKGVRIPIMSLPDPKDTFIASYRVLFEKITNKAIALQNEKLNSNISKTETVLTTIKPQNEQYRIDFTEKTIPNEQIVKESGQNEYGVDFNGFNGQKFLLKVTNNNTEYYRGIVTIMGSDKSPIKLDDFTPMNVLNYVQNKEIISNTSDYPYNILWRDIKKSQNYFYGLNFNVENMRYKPQGNKILSSTITFYNPNDISNNVTINKLTDNIITPQNLKGPVFIGPKTDGYSIMLSSNLAKKLNLNEKDVVYFKMK